jgi:hypothetical protein
LTYLASARSQPSQIITSNWSRGAEWRDWFVTGLGVTPIEYRKDEGVSARINQHLKELYQAEQAMLYSALLRRPSRNSTDLSVSLYEQMIDVDTAKTLVRFHMSLFYPDLLMDSDEIRGFLEGTGALVDGAVLRRFKESNVPVESINDIAVSRLTDFNTQWIRQSKPMRRSGSVALSVAHAITRLNALYQAFFALSASPAENDELIPVYVLEYEFSCERLFQSLSAASDLYCRSVLGREMCFVIWMQAVIASVGRKRPLTLAGLVAESQHAVNTKRHQ